MFDYGKPVRGENFFDRSKMKRVISQLLSNDIDFMIKAPRRYGKTSLVLELLGDTKHIYLDFRQVPRLSLIPEQLIDQAYGLLGIKGFFLKASSNVLSLIKEVKLLGKVNIEVVEFGAEIVLGSTNKVSSCEKMVDALNIVDKIGESLGKKITIVYDEFQDIKRLSCEDGNILEVLRGTLQHKRFIHSIFLGSIESIMTEIFESKKSPFFNYCRKMSLEPFDVKELNIELIEAFKKKKIIFTDDKILISILNRLGGHPANTMLTMQTLYFLMLEEKRELIKESDVMEAFERAYFEQLDLVTQYISEMKTKKHYHDVMYRIANKEDHVLTPQALYKVRKGLLEMGFLVQTDRDMYLIADSFLDEYLTKRQQATFTQVR